VLRVRKRKTRPEHRIGNSNVTVVRTVRTGGGLVGAIGVLVGVVGIRKIKNTIFTVVGR